jgi:hypothetical protein
MLTFEILQRMKKMYPAIQQNRQSVILFNETIPLIISGFFRTPHHVATFLYRVFVTILKDR